MTSEPSYRHTPDMGEISGMGDEYEECCQRALDAGVRWLITNPDKEPKYKGYDNVYGLVIENNQDAHELTFVLENAATFNGEKPEEGLTSAMHHALVHRLMRIRMRGWDWYVEEMRQHQTVRGGRAT